MADLPPVTQLSKENSTEKSAHLDAFGVEFISKYGVYPKFFARAPGRVNLIGEHIDYHGYGVLPMALDQDIIIACSLELNDPGQFKLVNRDPNYPEFICDLKDIAIDKAKPEWYHYVLCGLKGIFEHCKIAQPVGMKLMLEGAVPRSAGLSSSSAIVCASALTAAYANQQQLSKTELAGICTWSEKYIGTEGGGMDQSISYLAEEGTAKLINFNPLSASPVTLPPNVVFIVTNSCVELNKAATSHFNTRVLEGQLGVKIVAKSHGLDWQSLKKMKALQEALGLTFDELICEVKKILHPEPYSREEICKVLSISDEQFACEMLNDRTKDLLVFKVLDRSLHVLTESQRVLEFRRICDQPNPESIQLLGNLMNESHASCRDQYECSCPELDLLTQTCCDSGAIGSRLTGAGWAGCAVSLVHVNKAEEFLKRVKEEFYDARKLTCDSSVMFISAPGDGAKVYIPCEA